MSPNKCHQILTFLRITAHDICRKFHNHPITLNFILTSLSSPPETPFTCWAETSSRNKHRQPREMVSAASCDSMIKSHACPSFTETLISFSRASSCMDQYGKSQVYFSAWRSRITWMRRVCWWQMVYMRPCLSLPDSRRENTFILKQ